MHNFKQLFVWQKSIKLVVLIYKFTQTIPVKDQYIFTNQIMRSACSIPSNIAEGAGKDSKKDFNRYLSIAGGSSFELETQLIIKSEIYPDRKEEIKKLINELSIIQKMIFGLKRKLN